VYPLLCTVVPQDVPLPFHGFNTRSDMKSLICGYRKFICDNGNSNYQIVAIVPLGKYLDTTLMERKYTFMTHNIMQFPIAFKT